MPAWLFTILRNLFRSEYRKRPREVEDADGRYAETLKSHPEQTGRVEFEEFRAALAKLHPTSARRVRARFTRLLIVPTAQPQIPAASS
jgi:DNA-directed RNA polymerase specialized sigma24 family protein